MIRLVKCFAALLLIAAPAVAQTPPAPAAPPAGRILAASLDTYYQVIRRNFLEGAENMPAEKYSFQPGTMPEVYSFGRLMGHVAYYQYVFCAAGKGEPNPNKEDFEKRSEKASLVEALKAAFAYCDGVYGSVTDAMLLSPRSATNPAPRAMALIQNASHTNEHYGNMVTYYRLNNMVPPSTVRAQEQPPRP